MSRRITFFFLAMITGAFPGTGISADAPAPIPTSGDDYTGDRLILKTNVPDFTLLRDDSKKEKGLALKGTKLRVIHDKDGMLTVAVDSVPCTRTGDTTSPLKAADFIERFNFVSTSCGSIPASTVAVDKLVNQNEAYQIPKGTLDQYGFYRTGWVYGALLVPYKYHRDDKSFSSATTIGPYLGYQLASIGIDVALVASIGIASLSIPNGNGGTSTQQGYTAAWGIISSVTKNNNPLRLGLLMGKDWAGSNSPVPYAHEGKTWLAVQIGFDFTR